MKKLIPVLLALQILLGAAQLPPLQTLPDPQIPAFPISQEDAEREPEQPIQPMQSIRLPVQLIRRASEVTDGGEQIRSAPSAAYPYTPVYEPETSVSMAATVAWRADKTAIKTAAAAERPATCFVWLDRSLNVYDRNGKLLSDDLDAYVAATVGGMIPAFYIRDAGTAAALKAWLPGSGLLDCFVVSTPENKALVKDVADLLHIRGMLDYTSVKNPDRAALIDMVASTNGAHGKVILLHEKAATRANVRKLQSLASTVWVQTGSDSRSLMTAYTNGVNGVLVDDYHAALDALRWFSDDAPSLLRIPFIIGHRGDPSSYVENTLDSARGACSEGVDFVENDIRLSADGEVFIYHDTFANGLLQIPDPEDPEQGIAVERLTLTELQSKQFSWEDISQYNVVKENRYRFDTLYGQKEQKPQSIPSLREYIEEFKTTELVHDTEIKSTNPEILSAYKALVDEYDAWDQFITITFYRTILDTLYREYPEISVGALGMNIYSGVPYPDFDAITNESGAEEALKQLYQLIDRWNATYNKIYSVGLGRDMVKAGRHRGLTVWPWTYYVSPRSESTVGETYFARDYLFGVTGMTCNHPWAASGLLTEIRSEDLTLRKGEELPKPVGITQAGGQQTLETAEAVTIETITDRQTLMIWRYPAELILNGKSCGKYYLYSNPFTVTLARDNPFLDVKKGTYYFDAALWAVNAEPQVARGTSKTTFTPGGNCTRAQAVTFLWRAMGCPEPDTEDSTRKAPTNPFSDVSEQAYYYKAVLWATTQGITKGTSARTFSPNASCTREQIVTFLWRAAGMPGVSIAESPFKDVHTGGYAFKAILWALENGIALGTSKDSFSPKADCTRAQIVTFLWRAQNVRAY